MKHRIAFIAQPIDTIVRPGKNAPSSSLGIWTYEVGRCLSSDHAVTVYARQDGISEAVLKSVGINSIGIDTSLDDKLARFFKLPERMLGFPNPQMPFFATRWYYPGYIRQIARLLAADPPDIVHLFNFSQYVPVIRSACPQAKIVLHMQCHWLNELDADRIRLRLSAADLVLSCSDFVTQQTCERFPEHASRCRTLYNGVDTAFFAPNSSAPPPSSSAGPRLLFVGRVSPEKGVHVLLKAFRDILRVYPEAHLTIVGTRAALVFEFSALVSQDAHTQALGRFYSGRLKRGGAAGRYMEVLDALLEDIRDHVSFAGHVPHDAVREYYHRADVLLTPSVWHEPFGIPVVEGMACGLPVVASRSGGIPEIVVDGETGFIVERDNPDKLASAMLRLLGDPTQQSSMGCAGRQRAVACFDWKEITAQLVTLYDQLLDNS